MASYGATLRPSALTSSAAAEQDEEGVSPTRKALAKFSRSWAFDLPPDPEAAAVRAVRNIIRYRLYYTLLLWIILFASLVPRRRVSLIFLVATSQVAVSYGLLLRAFPNSMLLHRVIDRRLVVAVFLIVIVGQLVLTNAVKHLLLSLAAGVPIVLIHAVFRVDYDLLVTEEATELIAQSQEGTAERALESVRSICKALAKFEPIRAFGLPPDPEAAALRAVRNIIRYRLYYTLLLWVIVFASLVPCRPISLIFLVATSEVAVSYGLLLRAFPNSAFLHRIIDRRLVVALFFIVIVVQLVLTNALKHLLVSLASGFPIVLIHAVFRVDSDLLVTEQAAAGELDPIAAEKKDGGDLELGYQ